MSRVTSVDSGLDWAIFGPLVDNTGNEESMVGQVGAPPDAHTPTPPHHTSHPTPNPHPPPTHPHRPPHHLSPTPTSLTHPHPRFG